MLWVAPCSFLKVCQMAHTSSLPKSYSQRALIITRVKTPRVWVYSVVLTKDYHFVAPLIPPIAPAIVHYGHK